MSRMIMVRTTGNLHILGRKKFWKNLFRSRQELVISNPYFVDFHYNQNVVVDKVYLNTMRLLHSKPECVLNTKHVLFYVEPDVDLVDMYKNLESTLKQNELELEEL